MRYRGKDGREEGIVRGLGGRRCKWGREERGEKTRGIMGE
jgi:hypothetical protein